MRPAVTVTLLALLATAPAPGPARDPVRDGNAAVRRGELDTADGLYADAARLTPDPGLVALNRGVVELRRGRPRDAELHFLAALDDRDAPPSRRAASNYNLGLALLTRGGSAAVYRAAVSANERCLASPASPALAGDAAHNLELAKILGREAELRERQAAPPPPDSLPAEVARTGPEATTEPGTVPTPNSGATATPTGSKPTASLGPPRSTGQRAASRGTLPVLPDAEEYPPLSPNDARALLQGHAARLTRNRAASAEPPTASERANPRDW